jgi:arabinose operon protein AraL
LGLSKNYKGFIFDMDGTIYLENKMIDGASKTLNHLMEMGKHILFVTNKTTQTKDEYSLFLNNNNVKVITDQIITATDNTVQYLKKTKKGCKFYAIAEDSLIKSIEDAGLIFCEKTDEIDLILISLDRNYSNEKFEIAKKALLNGADFFAANIDNTCPVIKGEIVDAGTVISRLETETSKKLIQHFGKPSKFMVSAIEEKIKFCKKDYLLIGDRLETDILMGSNMGVDTVLVSSGVFNSVSNSTLKATFNVASIKEIL